MRAGGAVPTVRAVTSYQLFLYVHLCGAILWVGGASTMQLFALRARTRGPQGLAAYGDDMAWIGKHVVGPAALTTVAMGVAMVLDSPWSFSDDWITIALILFAAAYVLVSKLIEPAAKSAFAALAAGDLEAAERHGRRLTIVSRVELAVLFLIVFDMATKPTFADHGILACGVGGFAAATVAILWRGRAGGRIVPIPA
jgi:uncharacterized membrane protein